jgi:osmotically inducible protein OsmC
MKRSASAVWKGGLKDGAGTISTASGALKEHHHGFSTRFEESPGTNPEELIAAALAGCYSMALSGQLNAAGLTPTRIDTTAHASFEKTDAGWRITRIHLDTAADVPNATPEAFDKAANDAKNGCPVSNALKTEITLNARLTAGAKA